MASFEGVEPQLEKVLDVHLERRWLVEARTLRFGEALSLRYRAVVRDPDRIAALLRDVGAIEGVERVVVDVGEEGFSDGA